MDRFLFWSSLALVALTVSMVALTALGSPAGEDWRAQLEAIGRDLGGYRWGFVAASMLPVVVLAQMGALAVRLLPPADSLAERPSLGLPAVGALFVAAYAPLSALAYASQYTVLPAMVAGGNPAAATWFFDNPAGLPLIADLLAYALLGVGCLFYAPPLASQGGALRLGAWALCLSGVMSVAAFAFAAAGHRLATPVSLGSAVAWLLFVVALAVETRPRRTVLSHHSMAGEE